MQTLKLSQSLSFKLMGHNDPPPPKHDFFTEVGRLWEPDSKIRTHVIPIMGMCVAAVGTALVISGRANQFRLGLRIRTIFRSKQSRMRIYIKSYDEHIEERQDEGTSLGDLKSDYGEDVVMIYNTVMTDFHDEYVTTYDDIMQVRNMLKLSTKKVDRVEGHPHGDRARDRIIALNTIGEMAEKLKLKPYSVSTGPREEKRDWQGNKAHHFLMDVVMPIREDSVSLDHLIIFIDVDYYISRETFERYAGHKMVMFTVEIDAVGGADRESLWHVEGNQFIEKIAGGVTWKHQAWSYSGATCIIKDMQAPEGEAPAKEKGYWMYNVERLRFPGTNKMIVFLNPLYHSRIPWNLCIFRFGQNTMQEQLLYRVDSVTTHSTKMADFRIAKFDGPHPYVSLSYAVPTRHVARIPAEVWEGLIARRNGVNAFGSETVDSHLKAVGCKQSVASVLLVTAALMTVPQHINFVGYTADLDYLHEVENVAKITAPPLEPPAAASGQSTADMAKAVATLKEVRNTVQPDSEFVEYAKEFSRETAKRTPWTWMGHDETIAVMLASNPHRKSEIDAFVSNPANTEENLRAQIKADAVAGAAAKGKNPRLILPQSTYELYRATRCVKPWCNEAHKDGPGKCGHFYVCGNSPEMIAEKVTGAVRAAEANGNILTGTDFKKFDLHNSAYTRKCYVESTALSCQTTDGAATVRLILNSEVDKTIVPVVKSRRNQPSKERLKPFKSGTMCLSGAADTTSLNTHTNALVSYITMRRLGMAHLEAYDNIRPKYGDDGLEEFISAWFETIKLLGFEGTQDERESNAAPIDFLSRIFVKPMESTTSICEPLRAIRKLPTTCSNRPLEEARYDKANGYNITDGKTPLVGQYARAIMRVYGSGAGPSGAETQPVGSDDRELAFKIARGPFPYDDDDNCIVHEVVAARMGMDVIAVEQLCASYDAARTPADMETLATRVPSTVADGCRPIR